MKDKTKIYKTAFLSSRTISSASVLKCYDWATEMSEQGRCVVSGFHSKLEKDVLHFLLKGRQKVILVMGRAPYKILPQALVEPLKEGRLEIIYNSELPRQTKESAYERNKKIIEMADEVVFASLSPESSLYSLYEEAVRDGKKIIKL